MFIDKAMHIRKTIIDLPN